MSDVKVQENEERKRRVRRLKKYLIATVLAGITVPIILCVYLLIQVYGLQRDLKQSEQLMSQVSNQITNQQKEIDGLRQLISDLCSESLSPSEEILIQQEEKLPESSAKNKVYITFDDGPSAYTDEILDILDSYQVKATFFVVGKEEAWAQEALRQIVERGHSLGMHSYSHKYSELYQSIDYFEEDFRKLQNYLYDVTGVESHIYRFPGGSSNQVSKIDMKECITFLEEQDIVYYDWNVASGDASTKKMSVDEIVQNVLKDVGKKETSIILFHDAADKHTTIEALPVILEKIMEMEDTEILPITETTEHIQHRN